MHALCGSMVVFKIFLDERKNAAQGLGFRGLGLGLRSHGRPYIPLLWGPLGKVHLGALE